MNTWMIVLYTYLIVSLCLTTSAYLKGNQALRTLRKSGLNWTPSSKLKWLRLGSMIFLFVAWPFALMYAAFQTIKYAKKFA